MITGIGLDITDIKKLKGLHQEKLVNRILTEKEKKLMQGMSEARQVEFLAGRFAGKEAFSKALGSGIGKECSFQDIDILRDSMGAPVLYFKGKKVDGFISITHTKDYAAAQVILQS